MDLENLRTLLSVCACGSFQAAADAVGKPRTTLRRQVEALEAEIGVPLLHRDARGVTLTAAGEQVRERGTRLVEDADALLSAVRTGEGGVGTLRLVVPVGMPVWHRTRAVRALHSAYPGLVLDVIEADNPLSLVQLPFDYLIHFGERSRFEGHHSRVLFQVPIGLMASPKLLEEMGEPTTVEDLHRFPLLTWRVEPSLEASWPLSSGGSLPIQPALIAANPELLAMTAHERGGIAMLPRAASLFAPGGDLVPVLDGVVGGELTVHLLARRASRSEPRLRAMFENIDRFVGAWRASVE